MLTFSSDSFFFLLETYRSSLNNKSHHWFFGVISLSNPVFTADNSIFSCLKSLKELLDFNTLNCIVKYRLRLFFFRFSFAFSFSLSYSSILPLRFQILELLCDFFKKHFSQSFSPAGKFTYSHSYFFIKGLVFNIHSEMF